jgi:CspA family cold shock protein
MGTFNWFNATKGCGSSNLAMATKTSFVHVSVVEKTGFSGLAEGARISYELVPGRTGKMSAENLRLS